MFRTLKIRKDIKIPGLVEKLLQFAEVVNFAYW